MAVDGLAVIFGTATKPPPRCTKCNTPVYQLHITRCGAIITFAD